MISFDAKRVGKVSLAQRGEIDSGAEGAALARQDQRADRLVLREIANAPAEGFAHRAGHRIETVGVIETERHDIGIAGFSGSMWIGVM